MDQETQKAFDELVGLFTGTVPLRQPSQKEITNTDDDYVEITEDNLLEQDSDEELIEANLSPSQSNLSPSQSNLSPSQPKANDGQPDINNQFPQFERNIQAVPNYDAKPFFRLVCQAWHMIAEMLSDPNLEVREKGILTIKGMMPPELESIIAFEATIGRVNNIYMKDQFENNKKQAKLLDKLDKRIELYISPKLSMDNIEALDRIYKDAIEIFQPILGDELGIYKYRVFCEKDPFVESVEIPSQSGLISLTNDDIGIQHQLGYDEQKNMRIHLIIGILKPKAEQVLKPVEIKHENKVYNKWLPRDTQLIEIFLLNAMGEYAMTNIVGYLEFMPVDELTNFEPLDLARTITMIDNTKCNICCRKKFQVEKLFKCSRCNKTIYCSPVCQLLGWPEHSKLCSRC
jgi:hypothetical protein